MPEGADLKELERQQAIAGAPSWLREAYHNFQVERSSWYCYGGHTAPGCAPMEVNKGERCPLCGAEEPPMVSHSFPPLTGAELRPGKIYLGQVKLADLAEKSEQIAALESPKPNFNPYLEEAEVKCEKCGHVMWVLWDHRHSASHVSEAHGAVPAKMTYTGRRRGLEAPF